MCGAACWSVGTLRLFQLLSSKFSKVNFILCIEVLMPVKWCTYHCSLAHLPARFKTISSCQSVIES